MWIHSALWMEISIQLPPQEKYVAAGEGWVCLRHTSKFSLLADSIAFSLTASYYIAYTQNLALGLG